MSIFLNKAEVKAAPIGQSAGNRKYSSSSETTRESTPQLHFSKHTYPNDGEPFAYYLAGLVDGNGWISPQSTQIKIIICFRSKDAKTAFFIKKRVGFGSIRFDKNKSSLNYILTSKEGLLKVCKLLNGKLLINRKKERLDLILKLFEIKPLSSSALSLNNHYLSGLIDADGNFDIYVLNRPDRKDLEIRLRLKLDLIAQDKHVLEGLKAIFGGRLSYIELTQSWRYDSVSLKNMKAIICYLEKYQLISKYNEYRYLKKALWMVSHGLHLTLDGLSKILKYQKKVSDFKRVNEKEECMI